MGDKEEGNIQGKKRNLIADDALTDKKAATKKSAKSSKAKKPTKLKVKGKTQPKSKSGNSLSEGSEFEQLYAGRIRTKIDNFAKLHENHNIANISLEILFVDIYSLLEKEDMVEQDRFDKYAKPNMVEKTREVKVRHEKAGFFSKLLGLAPKVDTEIVQEKYMDEGPSEFKQDIQDAIVFYHFSRVEHADFHIEDIIKYTISNSFRKLGYGEYFSDMRADIPADRIKQLEELQLTFQSNKKEIEKGFEEVIVESHDIEPPKPE